MATARRFLRRGGLAAALFAGAGWTWTASAQVTPAAHAAHAAQAASTPAIVPAYVEVLQRPVLPEEPASPLPDAESLAIEAARVDADAALRLLQARRAAGKVSQAQFEAKAERYAAATLASERLANTGLDRNERARLFAEVADFNAGADYVSPLAKASLRRGEQGEVLVEKTSLASSVDAAIAQLRSTIPPGTDPRPAEAYFDDLRSSVQESIRTRQQASDALPIAEASGLVEPVQQAQMMMLSSDEGWDWNLRLRLDTSPSPAIVVFSTPSGYSQTFMTNTSKTVMRGKIEYTVIKPGYKTVTGVVDLINAEGEFSCVLVRRTSADPPWPCNAP